MTRAPSSKAVAAAVAAGRGDAGRGDAGLGILAAARACGITVTPVAGPG
jgi:molybdate-binding protein